MRLSHAMVVRDEVDLLPLNFAYHSRAGVDLFYVVGHLSSDGTSEMLERLSRTYRICVRRETGTAFKQDEWMRELCAQAYSEGADWCLLSDADEFWKPLRYPSIKTYLKALPDRRTDCLVCPWRNFVPSWVPGEPFWDKQLSR